MERPPEVTEPGFTFASGRSLNEGIYLFDVYLAPLMLAATPYVWCIPAYTGKQVILYDFGVPIRGASGSAVEPLQILSHRGVLHAAPAPTFERDSTVRATEWWSRRLNELLRLLATRLCFEEVMGSTPQPITFTVCSQLSSYSGMSKEFWPIIVMSTRDGYYFLASLIPSDASLTAIYHHGAIPRRVERTIRRIESSIPTSARKLLVPASHASLFGLQKLSDGFFFGLSPDKARVRLLAVRDRTQELSRNVATGRYLQLLRDATHGFGEKGGQTNSRDESLLTQHTGEIPDQLGLLSYTYLLDLLCDPGRLEWKLRRHTYE